jgi:hypothetical protein
MIYRFLVNDLVNRIAHSHFLSPSSTMRATRWAYAVSNWELARLGIMSESALDWVYLHSLDLPPLESLWNLSSVVDGSLIALELSAFVKFIDETYGPTQVVNLLHEVNVTPTLPEALKQLGLSYDDLTQKWEPWIKQLIESQS